MVEKLKYKRIVLKISGEALLGDQEFGIDQKPVEMIANEILCSVFRKSTEICSCETKYELSDNLNSFYEGKKNKGCSCSGSSC